MIETRKIPEGSFLVSPSPHAHAPGSIRTIMLDVLIALFPATVASIVFFGMDALILIVVCVASSLFFEAISRRIMKRQQSIGDLSAVVTGLLLAFNLPPDLPIWMAVVGSAFAIVVCKQLFGGLGYNPFNPALAARAFLLVSFTGAMTTWSQSSWYQQVDAVTTATPLGLVKETFKNGGAIPFDMDLPMIWRFAIGDINGCIGETSAIALLLGGLYLIFRRVISWHIPATFIGTVAVYAAILRFALPDSSMPISFHLLSGGLFLGAFFMATDMVTTPSTRKGKLIFGVCCGILTMVIRTVTSGDYPEGVSFSILIMNAFVPLINRATRVKPFGGAYARAS